MRQREIDPGTLAAFVLGEQSIYPTILAGHVLWSGCALEEVFHPSSEDYLL